jgi:hypothetical protein
MSSEDYSFNEPPMHERMRLAQQGASLGRRLSLREELVMTIDQLQAQIEVKIALLKLLDENPAIEQFMDLSRR